MKANQILQNSQIKNLLHFSSEYGHGVFTTTFLRDRKVRDQLRYIVTKNPSLFKIFFGKKRTSTIYLLTPNGQKYLGGNGKLTKSKTGESLKDLLTINRYLYQENLKIQYLNNPHTIIKSHKGNFGIISYKWGIPPDVNSLDYLVSPKDLKKIYLSNIDKINQFCQVNKLDQNMIIDKIKRSVTISTT